MNHPAQRYNTVSPIRTVITTIARKSVNKKTFFFQHFLKKKPFFSKKNLSQKKKKPKTISKTLKNIFDTVGQRLEGNSTAALAATATAVALYTKARAQSQQSRTETKVLHAIALKPPNKFGANTVVGRIPGRLAGESLDRLGNSTFRLGLQSQEQSQEQHVQPDKDQLTTDTADLKMTKDALAEETAFEDTTQDCLVCQTKVAYFEVCTNKNLSEELEVLVKAKIVISEKTGNAEYRDNRSVLSSHGGLVREVITSENALVQIVFFFFLTTRC